ncbi:MAG TPA: hypothetical protein VIV60_27635, partial [Polyangiaceae bacterium]
MLLRHGIRAGAAHADPDPALAVPKTLTRRLREIRFHPRLSRSLTHPTFVRFSPGAHGRNNGAEAGT